MTDGILDLLTAILVLGIVVAICFGFILPLTNTYVMEYDAQYIDKGAMNSSVEYGVADSENIALTHRMYTYEELLLLISVQDSRMEEPKALNIRNLMTSSDMSYSGYSDKYKGNGKTNALKDINDIGLDITDEAQRAIIRYAENPMETGSTRENSQLLGTLASQTKPNVGALIISDTFNLTKDSIITELNGAERNNAQYNGESPVDRYNDTFRLADRRSDILVYNATDGSSITNPDPQGDKTYKNRIYYISHHFAIPDDSKYTAENNPELKRADDEKSAFYVEIKGSFLRNGKIEKVDTYAEYQEFLKIYRENALGKNYKK